MTKEETVQEAGEAPEDAAAPKAASNTGILKLDLVLRIVAIVAILGSAIAMAATNQTFSFFTRFVRFRAGYKEFTTFKFFVVSNAITCGYLVISLLLSVFHIFKSSIKLTRAILIILDTIFFALLTAGASAAAAVVYLARNGNNQANWIPICQQYNSFCERVSGALVGTFIGVLVLMLLIMMSAVALSRD